MNDMSADHIPPSATGRSRVARETDLDPTVVGFNSRDPRSRPFNLLRTQIVRLVGEGAQLIGVTSPTPKVGKTFVACNLAASLSRLQDMKVTLVDLDLRRASVAERFGLEPAQGLAQYLEGEADNLDALTCTVEGQRLAILPTMGPTAPSAELLSGPRFAGLTAHLRSRRDMITICDLPPVFANDDTMIIAEHLDAYVLVVEDGRTTAKQVRDAVRLLDPQKFRGTILNRYIRGLGSDAYGYGYGDAGKYDAYYS